MLPIGAKVLLAHEHRGSICIWAEVDLEETTERRDFEIVATGRPLDVLFKRTYIGSAFLPDGTVFHVFERALTAKSQEPKAGSQ